MSPPVLPPGAAQVVPHSYTDHFRFLDLPSEIQKQIIVQSIHIFTPTVRFVCHRQTSDDSPAQRWVGCFSIEFEGHSQGRNPVSMFGYAHPRLIYPTWINALARNVTFDICAHTLYGMEAPICIGLLERAAPEIYRNSLLSVSLSLDQYGGDDWMDQNPRSLSEVIHSHFPRVQQVQLRGAPCEMEVIPEEWFENGSEPTHDELREETTDDYCEGTLDDETTDDGEDNMLSVILDDIKRDKVSYAAWMQSDRHLDHLVLLTNWNYDVGIKISLNRGRSSPSSFEGR